MPGRAGGLRGALQASAKYFAAALCGGPVLCTWQQWEEIRSAWEARLWMAGFWYVMSRRDAHLWRGRAAGGREARRHLLRS